MDCSYLALRLLIFCDLTSDLSGYVCSKHICFVSKWHFTLALLISAKISEHMGHTGLVLPVGSMNRNESVHFGLKALFLLSTFLFLESVICSLFFSSYLHLTRLFLNFLPQSRLYLSFSFLLACFSPCLHLSRLFLNFLRHSCLFLFGFSVTCRGSWNDWPRTKTSEESLLVAYG